MTDLIDEPQTVVRIDHEPYRTLIHLANGLHAVIESLDNIHLDGAAEPAPDATALDILIGSTVLAITSSDHGTLTITTSDGHTVTVPPDPRYEAWAMVSPTKGTFAVAMPGGDVAHWD